MRLKVLFDVRPSAPPSTEKTANLPRLFVKLLDTRMNLGKYGVRIKNTKTVIF